MMRLIFLICFASIARFEPINESESDIGIGVDVRSEIESEEQLTTASPSNFYDEQPLEEVKRVLEKINTEQQNQRLGYELLSKRLEEIQKKLDSLIANKSTAVNKPHKNFESCDEALSDTSAKDGVYLIQLPDQSTLEPFFVYCLRCRETQKAWTIIQRRMNGKVDFYRDWNEYKNGFGIVYGEYWLGLKYIHALTISRPHKLWIKLKDFENATHTAKYSHFSIGNECTQYTLNVLGEFSGSAGDSLSYSAGAQFQTKESPSECLTEENCATKRNGAWWFYCCTESHLNGEYLNGSLTGESYGMGISWYTWHGRYYSLKYAHMAIRPID